MITHAFDMAVANSWLEYKQVAENMGISKRLLHFKITLAEELVMVGRFSPGKKGVVQHFHHPVVQNLQNVVHLHLPKHRQKHWSFDQRKVKAKIFLDIFPRMMLKKKHRGAKIENLQVNNK